MATKSKTPFKKGRPKRKARSGGGSGDGESVFLPFKEGDTKKIIPLISLSELIYCDMHEYWDIRPAFFHACVGPDNGCPGCAIPEGTEFSTKPRFKGYLPVLLVEGKGKDKKVSFKIWAHTIKVNETLEGIEDAMDDESIKGRLLSVTRKGTSFDTTYTVVPLGERITDEECDKAREMDDEQIVKLIGPYTIETINALLAEKGWDADEVAADDDDDEEWDF